MVFIFSLVSVLCLVLLIPTYVGRYPSKQARLILVLLVLCLSCIGACVEPKMSYDLFRHYEMLDRVRESSLSLKDFLYNGYVITDANYKYAYVFNILVYTVAKFLPNQALPFISILVTYSVFLYILNREFEHNLTNRNIVLSSAIFSILIPYLFIYSGIRNALAAAVVAYGIYRFFVDRKVIVFIICSIASVLIHPVAVAIIPFIFLSYIKPGIKGVLITVALPSLMFRIMEFFRLDYGNDFLFKIAAKYYNYTMIRADNQGRVFLYSIVIILLIISILALREDSGYNARLGEKGYSLLNIVVWYSLFSLGYFRNYEMVTRLPYCIAFFSPVVVKTLFNSTDVHSTSARLFNTLSIGLISILAILGLYENIAWLI